jgi:hypothetical protein
MIGKIISALIIIPTIAWGAKLEDVKILDITSKQDGIKMKLQVPKGPKDSYFFLEINKADKDSFLKLGQVIKKLMRHDKYKLNLNIPSFSPAPSGSYYRSDDVQFDGMELK